ncbi:hypothetical protein DPEC_G00171120 [Dallia pectoralis]|uniref:Uncharacterized protein n=1 Tax=Dallia pectoralis TaxID=75939 RepID=A0ACC2GDN5_DALPE|nr:hypothetical protein DPEC_G00171120 [Dallia pectoralis]
MQPEATFPLQGSETEHGRLGERETLRSLEVGLPTAAAATTAGRQRERIESSESMRAGGRRGRPQLRRETEGQQKLTDRSQE